MTDDQLFALVALLGMLLWLTARLMPAGSRRSFERMAFVLVGGGIAVALVLSVLHFLA
jgi:hypothetical protein